MKTASVLTKGNAVMQYKWTFNTESPLRSYHVELCSHTYENAVQNEAQLKLLYIAENVIIIIVGFS